MNSTMKTRDELYFYQVNSKKIEAFNKHYRHYKIPGMPSKSENFYPKLNVDKKVKNPNRAEYEWPANNKPRYGWIDSEESVWVPSGQSQYGEPSHWNVEKNDGSYIQIFPTKKKLLWGKDNTVILTCNQIKLYSSSDEEVFFEWIKKIDCIENISGDGYILNIHIASDRLFKSDFDDLYALFYRYDIDLKQLQNIKNYL